MRLLYLYTFLYNLGVIENKTCNPQEYKNHAH